MTGARDDALASLRLRHVDIDAGLIQQDAREVRTKFSKTFPTGLSRCPASARCQRLKNCQAAATAVRHVSIAAARSVRCVWAEVRWRWTLKVL
jgi:hypothetical protein